MKAFIIGVTGFLFPAGLGVLAFVGYDIAYGDGARAQRKQMSEACYTQTPWVISSVMETLK